MRRKRFQRGSLTTRKRNGKNYWFAKWRKASRPRTREFGLCSKVSRLAAESALQEILRPINETAERQVNRELTFERFVESVYLPVFRRKWKASTAETEVNQLQVHLLQELGEKRIRTITREGLQDLLDTKARKCGHSIVDHLRFRLRSVF